MKSKFPAGRLLPILCLAAAILSGLYLLLGGLSGIVSLALTWGPAPQTDTAPASVGIIGGADGPTAIFLTASAPLQWAANLAAAVVFIASIACFLLFCKRKK